MSKKSQILLSCDLLRVLEIDEVGSFIALQFELMFEWNDPRVQFSNLKYDSNLNTLSEVEKNIMWVPEIIFFNTEQKEETLNDAKSFIVLEREGNYKPMEVRNRKVKSSILY